MFELKTFLKKSIKFIYNILSFSNENIFWKHFQSETFL